MKRFLDNEDGSTLLIGALMFPVLVGIAAFAVDLSNLYYNKAAVQRAADAASVGGVLALPDTTKAKS